MIFDRPQQPPEHQDRSTERLSSVAKLVTTFESSFSTVYYRVLESIKAVNAQASLANGRPLVDIYGGLAFHPAIRHDGLVFTLLHETGHHLSAGCKLPWAEMACECAADQWATTAGRAAVAANGASFRLDVALQEIELAAMPESPSTASPTRCWSMNWQERRRALLDGRALNLRSCEICSAIPR